jgi:probable F420-dependent oxidoreductase
MAPVLEHWLPVISEDPDQLVPLAQLAEEVGFAGIALADHVAFPIGFRSVHPSGRRPFDEYTSFLDPMTAAATALAATTRLRVMSYVYIVTMRDPFTTAKQVATLAVLSGDRFAFGVGAGWLLEEIALLGHDPTTRGARMDEQLRIMRALLRDGTVEHHGRHYDVPPTAMRPVPATPPPIWVGGRSDVALRRAARHDGWLGMGYLHDDLVGILDRLRRERERLHHEDGVVRDHQTLVIPVGDPTPEHHRELADLGITATVSMAWTSGAPESATFAAKREAVLRWAERFGFD